MPKQHTINLEAVIKAALDKNSEKIIDDFEKKITEPKEINIKTDEATQISMYNQQYMIKKDVHLLLIRIRMLMEDNNLITRMVS